MQQILSVSQENIDRFLAHFQEMGRGAGTLESYRRALNRLYRQLPEPRILDLSILESWRDSLEKENCSIQTKNVRIAAVNSFASYFGRRDLRLPPFRNLAPEEPEDLTREEYLRLLQAARTREDERLYLLIKTLCVTGVPLQTLPLITVESLRMQAASSGIPESLRDELLDYAGRHGIHTGPVFATRSGRPLERSAITLKIHELSPYAHVSEKKANPLSLRKLYQNTQSAILESVRDLLMQKYDELLADEEQKISWTKKGPET